LWRAALQAEGLAVFDAAPALITGMVHSELRAELA
jgi:hypothetical protein